MAFAAAVALSLAGLSAPDAMAQEGAAPAPQGAPPQGAPPAQPDQETMEKMTELRSELQQIQTKISTVQQEAAAKPKVQEVQKKYRETLNKTMTEKQPEVAKLMEKSESLREELLAKPNIQDPAVQQDPEIKPKLDEYRSLEQQIEPVRQEAAQDPACQEKFQEVREVLLAEMKKIDPEIEGLLEKSDQLSQEYLQLQQKARG